MPEQEINASQAISILIQGVGIAQSKGVYTLSDAEFISKAVKFFTKKDQSEQPVQQESSAPSGPEALIAEAQTQSETAQ